MALGHQVRFLGHASQRKRIELAGASFRPFDTAPDCDSSRPDGALVADWEHQPGSELFELNAERFVFGPAHRFAADVLAALGDEPSDVAAIDHMLLGALAAADSARVAHVALWHHVYAPPTVAVPPFGSGMTPPTSQQGAVAQDAARTRALRAWNRHLHRFNELRASLGLPPLANVFDQYDRAGRVLVMTSPSFDFAGRQGVRLPPNVRYVGPQLRLPAPANQTAGAATAPARPRILVSLGTTYQAQHQLLQRIVDSLAALPVTALVTTSPAVRLLSHVPANIEISPWLPQGQLFPGVDLVVTHAGLGTVMGSLAHSIPLVCIPIGRDQYDNTARVLYAEAGVQVSSQATVSELARATQDALLNPRLAARARLIADKIREQAVGDPAVVNLESHPQLTGMPPHHTRLIAAREGGDALRPLPQEEQDLVADI